MTYLQLNLFDYNSKPHHNARLTIDQVRLIRSFKAQKKVAILAKEFGVSIATISRIQNYTYWKNLL